MILHIGNDRAVPKRDIVAVLNVGALRRSNAVAKDAIIDMGACQEKASMRSVLFCVRDNREKLYGSPISASSLFARCDQL